MSDIRTLMREAAAEPVMLLRVSAIADRAARRGLRRRLALAVATLGALGGLVGGGQVVLSPADRVAPSRIDRPSVPGIPGRHTQDAAVDADGRPVTVGAGALPRAVLSASPTSHTGQPVANVSGTRRVAFAEMGVVYVANLDGTDKRRVSTTSAQPGPGYEAFAPTWSPDGARIAYGDWQGCLVSAGFGGTKGSTCQLAFGITIVNADGSQARRWVDGEQPAWSPDGQHIAFKRDDGIYLMTPEFSDLRRIPNTEAGFLPAWSPDSSWLAFAGQLQGCAASSECDLASSRIYVVKPDGSGLRRITSQLGTAPAWSPDGRRIAFESENDVWSVKVDGTQLTRLTIDPPATTESRVNRDFAPDWIDNDQIVWARDEGNPYTSDGSPGIELYVMSANGSGRQRLFPGSDPAVAPT